ncbi:MAG: hypothetical protein QGF33_13980, partial [Alphaproteobacteria bacterium]|nr:hypothetical protein [Alphaproteobacteria bacterium]
GRALGALGSSDGTAVAHAVDAADGAIVAAPLGRALGTLGAGDGLAVGAPDGAAVSTAAGRALTLGTTLGIDDGAIVGATLRVGAALDAADGADRAVVRRLLGVGRVVVGFGVGKVPHAAADH